MRDSTRTIATMLPASLATHDMLVARVTAHRKADWAPRGHQP